MFSTGLSCTYARRSRNFVSHCCDFEPCCGAEVEIFSGFFVVRLWKSQEEKSKNVKTKNQLQTSHRFRLLCCLSVDISLSRCALFVLAESKKGSQLVLWMFFIHFFLSSTFQRLLADFFLFSICSQTREWKLRRTKARQISIIFHTHQHSSAEHCRFQDVRNMKKILGKILILQELINQTTRCASSARGEVKSLLWLFYISIFFDINSLRISVIIF